MNHFIYYFTTLIKILDLSILNYRNLEPFIFNYPDVITDETRFWT